MNKPEVVCPHCKRVQEWNERTDRCINGCLWSNWFRARVSDTFRSVVRNAGL